MKIVIYALPGAALEVINNNLSKVLKQTGSAHQINVVSDLKAFLKKSLDSIPAVQIDNDLFCFKRESTFNHNLREVIKNLLSKTESTSINKMVFPILSEYNYEDYLFHAHQLCTSFQKVMFVGDLREKRKNRKKEISLEGIIEQIELEWIGSIEHSSPIIYRRPRKRDPVEMVKSLNNKNIDLLLLPLQDGRQEQSSIIRAQELAQIPIYLIPKGKKYRMNPSTKIALQKREPVLGNFEEKIFFKDHYLNFKKEERDRLVQLNEPILII